jgi:hypothetical protein
MANSSQHCRPIVYCTYARASDGKEFRDSVNFSRKRYHKIGEMSAKPLSREERRNKRKRSIESALKKEEIEKAARMSAVDKLPEAGISNTVEKIEDKKCDVGTPENPPMSDDVTAEEVKIEKAETNVDS